MPIGMSRPGLRHSSAAVETASNPMKAKKIRLAPIQTPVNPFGMNGDQFEGFTYIAPTTMKKTRMRSFSTTITLLNRADSFTPMTSIHVTKATTPPASRLKMT